MTKWTEFVRAFAKRNGLSYACALSTPACSQAYRESKIPKKKLVQQRREEEASRKYSYTMRQAERAGDDLERKIMERRGKAVVSPMVETNLDEPYSEQDYVPTVKAMERIKRKMPKPRPRIRAKGFMVMSQNEDSNGLTHIYRLSGRHLVGLYRS